jgi:hypothetical protein
MAVSDMADDQPSPSGSAPDPASILYGNVESPPPDGSSPSTDDRLAALYPDSQSQPGGDHALDKDGTGTAAPTEGAASYQLLPPEGFEIDDEILAEVAPVFRELNLDNEQANKLMPLAGKLIERITDATEDEFAVLRADWARQTKADPKIGQANWPETERLIARALDAAGAPIGSEFRQYLNETGLGNHPEMIRIFRYFGTLVDRPAGARASSRNDVLDALYPSHREAFK